MPLSTRRERLARSKLVLRRSDASPPRVDSPEATDNVGSSTQPSSRGTDNNSGTFPGQGRDCPVCGAAHAQGTALLDRLLHEAQCAARSVTGTGAGEDADDEDGHDNPNSLSRIHYACPICGESLAGAQVAQRITSRVRHLKACAAAHGLAPGQLGELGGSARDEEAVGEASADNNDDVVDLEWEVPNPAPVGRDALAELMQNARHGVHSRKRAAPCKPAVKTIAASRQRRHYGELPVSKRVPGTNFVVDGFLYASALLSQTYFLTHFHADHTVGLSSSFGEGDIWCSLVTARLIRRHLRIDPRHIKVLELNRPTLVANEVQVVAIDANHCPGAVMFLFTLRSGKAYLHTGDFRWSREEMCANQHLSPFMIQGTAHGYRTLEALYLDTTYASRNTWLPPKAAVVEAVPQFLRQHGAASKRVLVVVGAYQIGKERVWMHVAESLDERYVALEPRKLSIVRCLDWSLREASMLTQNRSSTRVWVVSMSKLTIDSLEALLRAHRNRFDAVIGVRPTGWASSAALSPSSSGSLVQPEVSCTMRANKMRTVKILSVPYSEHSSYHELCDCVRTFRTRALIPTVVGSQENASAIVERLRGAM